MKTKTKKTRNARKVELADRQPADRPTGRFWSQWLRPRGVAFLAQTVGPMYFVVKNCGDGTVCLAADNGDLTDVPPGTVRATYAHGNITVKNRADKPCRIEFDFLPINRR
jgi:hypothetical protein